MNPISRLLRLQKKFRLYAYLLRDRRTPVLSKALLFFGVIYTLFPIDIVPDFIPFAGYLDDAIIVPLLFYVAFSLIPKDLYNQHKQTIGIDR